jgi:hypothetical protein
MLLNMGELGRGGWGAAAPGLQKAALGVAAPTVAAIGAPL